MQARSRKFAEAQKQRRRKKFRQPRIPALRPTNDFGDRTLGGYNGSVRGIDHIVRVVHDHRNGVLEGSDDGTSGKNGHTRADDA